LFVAGNGATEVIGFLVKAFCEEGDNVVTADRTFAVEGSREHSPSTDARFRERFRSESMYCRNRA
jgi:hypothetical protein